MRPGRALRSTPGFRQVHSTAAVAAALAGCHTAASDRQRPPQQLGEPGRLKLPTGKSPCPTGLQSSARLKLVKWPPPKYAIVQACVQVGKRPYQMKKQPETRAAPTSTAGSRW